MRLTDRPASRPVQPGSLHQRGLAFGGFLFRQRSWTPIPVMAFLLLCGFREAPDRFTWLPGLALLGLGEGLRLWGVAVVGKASRTRGGGTNRLMTHGPYAYVRNPLYLGNLLLTLGATCLSELLWALPIVATLYGIQYVPIVLWEERNLRQTFGSSYATYCQRVPRWIPRWPRAGSPDSRGSYQWRAAFWSERSTLGTVGLLILLMLAKENLHHLPKYLHKHALLESMRHPSK